MKSNYSSEERLKHLSELLPAGYDINQTMQLVTEYVHSLDETFEEFKKSSAAQRRAIESELRARNKQLIDNKHELDRLTGDLMELTNTLEEQDSLMATANQKVANYEKQFKKLHRENSELANRLNQKENDANFYRTELERNVRESETMSAALDSANHRIDELERKLSTDHQVAMQKEKEARKLNLALSESQNKVALAEQKMEQLIGKYSNEIKRLSDRSNADSVHEINLMRKRIRAATAPEIRELNHLMGAKLTPEIASNLRSLFSRFVTKLEQAGLNLKEAPLKREALVRREGMVTREGTVQKKVSATPDAESPRLRRPVKKSD